MATLVQNLITARDNLAAELATNSANPKPTYSVAGRSVSWSSYRSDLIDQIERLNGQIIKARGAVEIPTIALG